MFAPTEMELEFEGGATQTVQIPPHPNLRVLEDERLAAYEALLFKAETEYDREPDVILPEQKLDNGVIIPAETRRGVLKTPYRITTTDDDGQTHTELVTPPYAVQVVIAVLGDEVYEKIKAAGKSSADVWRIWNEQGMELAERNDGDPKSVGGRRGVAQV